MNLKLRAITLVICTALLSCRKDCDDMMFPKQHFAAESLTFQSWVPMTKLVYKDSVAQEYHYDVSTFVDLDKSNLLLVPCDSDSSLLVYECEYYLKRFTSPNNTSVVYVHSVVFVEDENVYGESNLIDQVGASVYNDNLSSPTPISHIRLITSVRESSYDQKEYNSTYTVLHDSLKLFDKTFYNVYEQKSGNPRLFFTKDKGIVSLTDNAGVKLVLERTE